MTEVSNIILEKYLVRKSKKQKNEFISFIKEKFPEAIVQEEKGIVKSKNIVIGDVKNAKTVLGAHYDTPAALPFPNFLAPKNAFVSLGYQVLLAVVMLIVLVTVASGVFYVTDNVFITLIAQYIVIAGLLFLLMAGKANKNNYNDNTSGIITLIETMSKLSSEEKEKTAFVFFDNEELGLLGSRAFKKRYKKEMKDKLLINFDCVSDGDYFLIICNRKTQKVHGDLIDEAIISSEEKTVVIDKAIKTLYPSDQMGFPMNIGVAAFKKNKLIGYYIDRIHTKRDTIFQKENIEFLSDRFSNLIKKI